MGHRTPNARGHAAIAGGTRRQGEVLLAWALDREGRKVHVARLDARSRRDRAPFACPGCGERLVPHLGAVRARHFAHEPGSRCPLTAPETALHLNAKERLLALCAEGFASPGTVRLRARCPGCRRPAPVDLAAMGDEARDEERVGARRADVLILKGGRPALAIEVRVTHAVDEAKADALAALGVQAVEIDAREDWEQVAGAAIEIVPIRSLGFPPCPACAALARAERDRAAGGEAPAIAELEEYRSRGLLGPRVPPPGPPADPGPLAAADRASLASRFQCPTCGGVALEIGERLARHPCPVEGSRPVAWRGYDGALVELTWWLR